ncbi:lachesin-like [Cydia strobilella]|uniref:lachesin-like n=1 Tax=Cydia strobilella TaxID=1100964 RepID=UPI0030076195
MKCSVRIIDMIAGCSARARSVAMETGGLPLVSTFALLTIVAGQLQVSGYNEKEPEFLSPLENLTVAQGREVYFTCTVNRLGKYKVAWIKSDTKTILAIHTHMVTLNPRLSVTHNGHNTWKLYISNVDPEDSGTYMCQVNTDPMMSQMGHLSVVIPPDITDDGGSEASALEGGAVELRCTATGVPEPTISWKRTGGRNIVFRDDNGKQIKVIDVFKGSTLALKGLQRSDIGTYLCIAANSVPPTKSRRYEVSVHFKPSVEVELPVVMRAADKQVTLQCHVEASPKSLNTWQRDNSPIGGKLMNSSKYIISEEIISEYALRMNLTVTRLKKGDFGEYSCAAANAFGRAEGVITLKETPQRTTTKTTTTTTTTTPTSAPTTSASTTTRQPKRHHKNQNVIVDDMRQADLGNAINLYNTNAYAPPNDSHNEHAQRTERKKARPSGPPYVLYNSETTRLKPSLALALLIKLFV